MQSSEPQDVLHVTATIEAWPLANPFVISRGAKTEARVVVVTVTDGKHTGRGECVPYSRYGETPEDVAKAINTAKITRDRFELHKVMSHGAARNALDCALWDLEAKSNKRPAEETAGLAPLKPALTCFTISLDTPEAMAAKAASVQNLPLLKLKLGGDGDDARMKAVRKARPSARLVADANEAWTPQNLSKLMSAAAECRLELIEQPLPAGKDGAFEGIDHLVPICADESVHVSADLPGLRGRYDAVNIKLDKAGGLTEALIMAQAARDLGLKIMAGSMVGTSLAAAPALLLAQYADWIDLDGPLLLSKDREPALSCLDGVMQPPLPALWG